MFAVLELLFSPLRQHLDSLRSLDRSWHNGWSRLQSGVHCVHQWFAGLGCCGIGGVDILGGIAHTGHFRNGDLDLLHDTSAVTRICSETGSVCVCAHVSVLLILLRVRACSCFLWFLPA